MRHFPEFATFAGVNLYNDKLDPYNMTIYTTNKVKRLEKKQNKTRTLSFAIPKDGIKQQSKPKKKKR